MCKSAAIGNLDSVKNCLANDVNVNAKDELGYTALMQASQNGHFEIVKYLVSKDANVNAKKFGSL
ncbi:ankyrin repeat domain-containing protein [Helicobacter sp. 23-1045]